MKYVPLYVKTEYSLLKSMIKITDLIEMAKNNGYEALTITDENMFGTMEFYELCVKNNIKPIIGLEVSFNDIKIVLYAKNYDGYKNLIKLATISSERDIINDDILNYSSDLICILPYEYKSNLIDLNKIYREIFIGYKDKEEFKNLNIRNKIYMKETLYLNKTDKNYINYLTAIKDGCLVSDIEDIYTNNYLLPKEEVESNDLTQSNTEYIINNCNVVIKKRDDLLPIYDTGELSSYEYLKKLVKEGLKERYGSTIPKVYVERLKYELDVINKMGFCNYFLVVWDYVNFAKKNGILVGPGRGSAAGSLVSYTLKITDVDPIKYNLLFERFLNPERITMPDIDIDFLDSRREEVIEYCVNKYGMKKVSGIITFGTLASKQAIRDVIRTSDLDISVGDNISKMISSRLSLRDNYNQSKKLQDYLKSNKEYMNIYKVATKLEGLKRHTSIHAAGIVMSNVDLDTVIPLYKHDNMYLSGYSMNYLENLGLLKMDFLGLKNLNIIDRVIKDLNHDNINIDFDNIPLNDLKALDIFNKVNTVGIFQFESEGMKNFLRKFKPTIFEDIFACLALYRPGPMGNIDTYIKRKEGKEKINYYAPSLEPILKPTYGILIYQEQIMQVASTMAGYTFGQADILRRAMSKKKEDVLIKEKDNFIAGAINKGYTKELSTEVYDLILKFASYGFNRAHSVAYAIIAYKMAYLKAHFPAYFLRSLLNMSIGSITSTKDYIYEAKTNNISILPPDINKSSRYYTVEGKSIRYPLYNIKNVGTQTIDIILKTREESGSFKDIYDFVKRTYGKAMNTKVLTSLIYAGCFDSFNVNRKTLIHNLDAILNYGEVITYLDEESTLKPVIEEQVEYTKRTLMLNELDVFGFYLSNHPVSEYRTKLNKNLSISEVEKYFDKNIEIIVGIKNFKTVETKKKDFMGFITGEDEIGIIDIVMFPTIYKKYDYLKVGDIILINAHVEKRFDKIQLILNTLKVLNQEFDKNLTQ